MENQKGQKTENPYNAIDLQRTALWVGAVTLIVDSICLIVIGEFEWVIALGLLFDQG